jgi:hypothetical protein
VPSTKVAFRIEEVLALARAALLVVVVVRNNAAGKTPNKPTAFKLRMYNTMASKVQSVMKTIINLDVLVIVEEEEEEFLMVVVVVAVTILVESR